MPSANPRQFTQAELEQIKLLEAEGKSISGIAKAIGRSPSSVRIKIIEIAIREEIADGCGGRLKWVGYRPTWVDE